MECQHLCCLSVMSRRQFMRLAASRIAFRSRNDDLNIILINSVVFVRYDHFKVNHQSFAVLIR